jgi:hypothetical protein
MNQLVAFSYEFTPGNPFPFNRKILPLGAGGILILALPSMVALQLGSKHCIGE